MQKEYSVIVMIDFDEIIVREGTSCVKYAPECIESMCGNPHAHPFWVADMDFLSPECVRRAVVRMAEHGVYGYSAIENISEDARRFIRRRHGLELNAEDVIESNGILNALALLVNMLTAEGDGIVVQFPSYKPFPDIVDGNSRKLINWPLKYNPEKAEFTMDMEEYERICRQERPAMLIFCSPHNPSGRVWSKEELAEVSAVSKKYSVKIVSDEIHADMTFHGEHHFPFTAIDESAITLMAPSKTFNIAGEHFSVTIIRDREANLAFRAMQERLRLAERCLFSRVAAKAAYDGGYDWLMELTSYLEENVNLIDGFIRERNLPLRLVRPSASFIAFLDCSEIYEKALSCAAGCAAHGGPLSEYFGKNAGICVNDGSWFGKDWGRFVRFNYGAPRSIILKAFEAIEGGIK